MPEAEVDHSSRAHAEFSPSQLKHLKRCPAYQGRSGTNAAAERGTRIHEALEIHDPSGLHDEEEHAIYQKIVDEETHLLTSFFSDPQQIMRENEIRLEIELDCATPVFGTLDVYTWDHMVPEEGLAIDYKTGYGYIDPPEENYQAIPYAIGLFQKYPKLDRLTFVFICPVRDETLIGVFHRKNLAKMREEVSNIIKAAEVVRPKWKDGQPDMESCNPSPECRFCKYENRCPALGAVAIDAAKRYAEENEKKFPEHLKLLPEGPISGSKVGDPIALQQLYIAARVLEKWVEGIKHKVVTMALDEGDDAFPNLTLKDMGAPKEVKDGKELISIGVEHGLDRDEIIDWEKAVSLTRLIAMAKEVAPKGKKTAVAKEIEAEAFARMAIAKGSSRYTMAITKAPKGGD